MEKCWELLELELAENIDFQRYSANDVEIVVE